MISIRPAHAHDKGVILRQMRQERLNPLGNRWRNFLVAENTNGEIVGFGQLKRHRDGSTELASLVVIRGWRRQGIAGALITELKKRGGPPLWLTCRSGLSPFYARYGFETVQDPGMMPTYFRLARILGYIHGVLWRGDQRLAIMRWNGQETLPI